MKKLILAYLLLAGIVWVQGADNFVNQSALIEGNARPLMRSSDVSGIHTPHVIIEAPAATDLQGTVVSSTAYEKSHVLKSSAGTLVALIGYNSNASAQFIQVHNAASLPADTAVPIITFTVAATSNFSLTIPITGLPCSTGIVVCSSSTGPTKTLGGASDVFYTGIVR